VEASFSFTYGPVAPVDPEVVPVEVVVPVVPVAPVELVELVELVEPEVEPLPLVVSSPRSGSTRVLGVDAPVVVSGAVAYTCVPEVRTIPCCTDGSG